MAHKSKKKHLKHLHAQQRASASSNVKSHGSHESIDEPHVEHRGIVRSIAHAAKEKLVEEEKKIAKKVKSLLG